MSLSKRKLPIQDSGQKMAKIGLFSAIPAHNQMDILKKLDFKDFVKFKKCSKETMEITTNFRHRLSLKFEYILSYSDGDKFCGYSKTGDLDGENMLELFLNEPVRLECENIWIMDPFTNRSLEWLKMFCTTTQLTINDLDIDDMIIDPLIINELIKILKSKILNLISTVPEDLHNLIGMSEFINLEKISFFKGEVDESDLLLLKTPGIELFDISVETSVINKILKQWKRSERRIKDLEIVPIKELDGLLQDLEPSVLWTPETDATSPLAHLGLAAEKVVISVHSMTREDGGKLLVFIHMEATSLHLFAREYEDLRDIEKWYSSVTLNGD